MGSMVSPWKLIIFALLAFAFWKLGVTLYHQLTSPLRALPGPNGTSWIYGNLRDTLSNSAIEAEWVKEYGTTLTYKGLFHSNRLYTMDTRALNHILTHSTDYQKPSQLRYILSRIVGPGVVFAEGAEHRQQRRVMNPAFGPAQIRALTDIFLSKSIKLRDIWFTMVAASELNMRIDIMPWLSRMTLDVIGLAGFNCEFDALNTNEKPNELMESFFIMFYAIQQEGIILPLLKAGIPFLRWIHSDGDRKVNLAQKTMNRIGCQLINEAKAGISASGLEKGGVVEKSSLPGRDLLSLLVRANMATDLPENQKLSDDDVLAQVPAFLVAGHETTSTTATYALYELCLNPELQTKLREELSTVQTERPSMDQLMALPFLDAMVRETLRVHAPIPFTIRVAMKDDVIPVDTPFRDKHGVVHEGIKVRKGDLIDIPILAINKSETIWGTDANEFNPERWSSLPDATSQVPGVWGHLMSFLGGPRACIGYRFSLVEIKALLFTLIKAFEFELAVPASDIKKKWAIVERPILLSDPEQMYQLALLVKPCRRV